MRMSAVELANFVWAHAHLAIPLPPAWLDAVDARVLQLLTNHFRKSPSQAPQILWSFAVMGHLETSSSAGGLLTLLTSVPTESWNRQTFLQMHQIMMCIKVLSNKYDGGCEVPPIVADLVRVSDVKVARTAIYSTSP